MCPISVGIYAGGFSMGATSGNGTIGVHAPYCHS